MFNLVKIIRNYAGLSQMAFAENAGLTQPDLHELETKDKPYGIMEKYLKVSRYTGIPVDAILRNDFRQIPMEFFRRFPAAACNNAADSQVGRSGEERIFSREQARLAESFPNLSPLVLPYFKMDIHKSPGYDILSFDDEGQPFALEVKSSSTDVATFRLSTKEKRTAQQLTAAGERYQLALVSHVGTARESIEDVLWTDLEDSYDETPAMFRYQRKAPAKTISGLTYHRQRLGIRQSELARLLGVKPCNLSSTENWNRGLIAAQYVKASDILGVPVDDLLKTYRSDELEATYEA